MPDSIFATAFTLWTGVVTWLELLAFSLALAMVLCNIRTINWGWPLAAISSLLYMLLFWRDRLYGESLLQVVFAVISLWGWAQWLRKPSSTDKHRARIAQLSTQGRLGVLLACATLWPMMALFSQRYTNTDVPWWDALTTSLSVVAQWLLARKYIENWLLWVVVNVFSVGLFAYKGLWLTAVLYCLFIALSVVGWHAWRAQAVHTR